MSKPYVISRLNGSRNHKGEIIFADPTIWYCHHRDYPWIPVFGSIGSRNKALKACRLQNTGKVSRGERL